MIARVFALSLVVLGILAACGGREPGRTPSGARASCETDADCAVADRASCCSACPEHPFAIPADELARQQNKCKTASCGASSDRIECPQIEAKDAYAAVCKDGTCAVKKK